MENRFVAPTNTTNATTNKSLEMRDRTGLRLTFAGLLPINTGDDGRQRIWGAAVTLNSELLEPPEVDYKLRVNAKRGVNPRVTCDNSKGVIKQNDILVIAYQLPESSIETVRLTILIDGSPYEVPLFKIRKADYYWLGKHTDVPDVDKLQQAEKSPKMEPTPQNESPGRFEHLSSGLQTYLGGTNGLASICRLLHPHATSLFRDLSTMRVENCQWSMADGGIDDDIAAEIVKRFHEANREKFATTPTLLQ